MSDDLFSDGPRQDRSVKHNMKMSEHERDTIADWARRLGTTSSALIRRGLRRIRPEVERAIKGK